MPRKRLRKIDDDSDERPRIPAQTPELRPGAPSDLELMEAIQREEADALSQLYDRYNGILKALILRVIHNETEADDLLQEIFVEIWNQSKNFSAEKGKPLGWMVTLARRRAIDGLRKKQAYARAEERLQQETEQQPDAWVHNTTEEEIEFGDRRVLIRRVITTLPEAQQRAVELAFFRGMSQREIAAKTNTPLGTVKTRLELGLKKIYDGLKELRDELEEFQNRARLFVIGALEDGENEEFEKARREFGQRAEDFISECYSLSEAFALSLKPAKTSEQIKNRLMELVRERKRP